MVCGMVDWDMLSDLPDQELSLPLFIYSNRVNTVSLPYAMVYVFFLLLSWRLLIYWDDTGWRSFRYCYSTSLVWSYRRMGSDQSSQFAHRVIFVMLAR